MLPGRSEDEVWRVNFTSLQVRKWVRKENMRARRVINQVSKMTAALCPHNHDPSSGCGWCLWYDAMNISSNLTWSFHLLPTTPSDRRLGDFEIAMKQSRYDMMKDSSIEIRFGSKICLLSLMFMCCAGDHVAPWVMTVPAPTWFWYSPACTSFIEMESQ